MTVTVTGGITFSGGLTFAPSGGGDGLAPAVARRGPRGPRGGLSARYSANHRGLSGGGEPGRHLECVRPRHGDPGRTRQVQTN